MELTKVPADAMAKFVKGQLADFEGSPQYARMKDGRNYYNGLQAIDSKRRMAIGENGRMQEILNVPNNRIKDNQYAKLVDQKTNYMLTQRPTVACETDDAYAEELGRFIDMRFMRTLNYTGIDMFNESIGWWFLYTDGVELKYQRMDPLELVPIWEDNNQEALAGVIRKRAQSEWSDSQKKTVDVSYVDLHTPQEVITWKVINDRYEFQSKTPYLQRGGKAYTWEKVPFVYFRFNRSGTTLLDRVKSLQDGINTILSNFADNMLEDARNTILVLKGYDGEDLGEFRSQLAQYGAVKLEPDSHDGSGGSLTSLQINVNAENYKSILSLLKEKLIENGRGIDAKNDKTGNQPNELNIKSMYSDIELDANRIELEMQASFEYLQWFYKKVHNIQGDPIASLTFKRNIMVNEESMVRMIKDSIGIVSEQTLREQHPLVDNAEDEEIRMAEEKESARQAFMDYQQDFRHADPSDEGVDDGPST